MEERPRLGRPRDQRLDAAIVEATLTLLEERGYHDLTLAAVAARAGTTTAAIYRRWSSKSELVTQAVYRTEGDDVVADTGDVVADVTTMVRWTVDKVCRTAAVAALAGLLGESGPERAHRIGDVTMASRRVAERLERAKATGEIRADVDTDVMVSLISGPVVQVALLNGGADIDDAWVTGLVSVILDGVRPPTVAPSRPTRPTSPESPRAPERREATNR